MADYKEGQWKHIPLHELTNMPDMPPGIISLHEMAKYIDNINYKLLRFIDALLDDRVLDSILPHQVTTRQSGK